MAKIEDVRIAGKSGKQYTFEVYPFESNWNEVAAVYVVTKRVPTTGGSGTHTLIYVGQTDKLKERHASHHKADCFLRYEGNCLCVLVEANEQTRLAIEDDLLKNGHAWPCNG